MLAEVHWTLAALTPSTALASIASLAQAQVLHLSSQCISEIFHQRTVYGPNRIWGMPIVRSPQYSNRLVVRLSKHATLPTLFMNSMKNKCPTCCAELLLFYVEAAAFATASTTVIPHWIYTERLQVVTWTYSWKCRYCRGNRGRGSEARGKHDRRNRNEWRMRRVLRVRFIWLLHWKWNYQSCYRNEDH